MSDELRKEEETEVEAHVSHGSPSSGSPSNGMNDEPDDSDVEAHISYGSPSSGAPSSGAPSNG